MESVGIVLQRGENNSISALLKADIEITSGQLFLIEDGSKKTVVRLDEYSYINEFFDEKAPFSKTLLNDKIDVELLHMNTVIKAEMSIVKRYNHSSVPKPGSIVKLLPEIKDEKDLLSFYQIPSLQGYIEYGRLAGSKIPLLLDLNAITMHIGIFGETGSGKSYNMRYLITLLSNIKLGDKLTAIPMIIIDANGDYSDFTSFNIDLISGGRGWIKKYVMRDTLSDAEVRLSIDLSLFTAKDLADFIISLKYGDSAPNSLQSNLLEQVLLQHDPQEYNWLLGSREGIEALKTELEELKTSGFSPSTIRAVNSSLEVFYGKVKKYNLVSSSSSINEQTLDVIWNTKGLGIIDFSSDGSPGVDISTKQLIVSYIARLILDYLTKSKYSGKQKLLALVIEEAQNYIPSSDYPVNARITKDVLVTLATQGRKFGVSLFLVSQRPAFVDKYVLSMLNTFFFHRIYHEDVKYVMSATGGLPEHLSKSLPSLDTGYVIVSGLMSALRSPALVKIPWDDRIGSYAGYVSDIESILVG
ncbi:ATP-binding protein [Sulfurisphaera javensis]|uniref:ATP-binding protein n=1 Tax=Sulfurisphaera javensis TaxID=2049879 RepID=A0AAT9GSN1_9CREN